MSVGRCQHTAGRLRPSAALLAALLAVPAPAASASDPFTVVLVPDTQHVVDDPANHGQFLAQMQWIAGRLARDGIVLVTHVGDVVENGGVGPSQNAAEWAVADAALDELDGDLVAQPDGLVPYGVCAGNHDYDAVDVKDAGQQFRAWFGPARYAGRAWFLGSAPGELNMAQTFVAGGRTWLHLSLEWRPSDAALLWAQQVLDGHPGAPAIVSTHEHLRTGDPAPHATGGKTNDGPGDNDGLQVYRKLVEPFPQVLLVLSGHVFGDGRRTSTTALGRTVHELLADYQADPNGGNGWTKELTFRPGDGALDVRVASATYVPGVTAGPDRALDPAGNFTLAVDVDAHAAALLALVTRRFRQGQDAGAGPYEGTHDTHVGSGQAGAVLPDVAHGDALDVRVDGNGDREQGLLRFDDLVGPGPGRLPSGASVQRAILTLTTEGAGSESATGAALHRLLVPWDEGATWNALGGGVQVGVEAQAVADAVTGALVASKGTLSFDVTASVAAWVAGEANHGWALLGLGNDGWSFRSSEWAAVVERPLLTVQLATGFTDLGAGLAGSAGVPAFAAVPGSDTLAPLSPLALTLADARPSAAAWLVLGTTRLDAPFEGGTFVPWPDLLLPFPTDSSGSIALATVWPPGVPAGAGLYLQWWIDDPTAPHGWSASNALLGVTPNAAE